MSKIREDEHAVKLTSDINGGLGKHAAGTVLRNLPERTAKMLVITGKHEKVAAGTEVRAAKSEDVTEDTTKR